MPFKSVNACCRICKGAIVLMMTLQVASAQVVVTRQGGQPGSWSPVSVSNVTTVNSTAVQSTSFYYLVSPTTKAQYTNGDTVFVAGTEANVPNPNGNWFVNFNLLDITHFMNDSSESGAGYPNAIVLNISTVNFPTSSTSTNANQLYALTMMVGSTSPYAASFAAFGPGNYCSSGSCQWQVGSQYFAVPMANPQSTELQISFYANNLCSDATVIGSTPLATACQSSYMTYPTAGKPTMIPLQFNINTIADNGITTQPDSGGVVDSASINLYFLIDGPTVTTASTGTSLNPCANMGTLASSVQLGDGSIDISTNALFANPFVTTGSPVGQLWAVINQGTNPPLLPEEQINNSANSGGNNSVPPASTTSVQTAFDSDQHFLNALLSNNTAALYTVNTANNPVLGPLQNSTADQMIDYTLQLFFQDQAGAIVNPSNNACLINNINVSMIQGFLNESKCFIATATYHNQDVWGVRILRQFRDEVLLSFGMGKKWVKWYEKVSPAAANWLLRYPSWRFFFMGLLLPFQGMAWSFLYPLHAVFLFCSLWFGLRLCKKYV